MWRLTLEDNTIITERMVRCWDNIGKDTKIKEVSFRISGEKIVFSKVDKYCVARVGQLSVSAQQRHVGYCVTTVCDKEVTETKILFNGIKVRKYPLSELQIPDKFFRYGVK